MQEDTLGMQSPRATNMCLLISKATNNMLLGYSMHFR